MTPALNSAAHRMIAPSSDSGSARARDTAAGVAPGRTAMLVDDNLEYRELIRELLAEEGWNVIEASTGEDALALLETIRTPDALVIETSLGKGMDGWAFARRARKLWPDLGLLFVSGEHPSYRRYQQVFSAPLLFKPFTLADFLTSIAGVVRTVRAEPMLPC